MKGQRRRSRVQGKKGENNFEAPAETDKRRAVLEKLQEVAEEFIRHVGRVKGMPQSVIDTAGGKIVTFGSYRLGVYGPGIKRN